MPGKPYMKKDKGPYGMGHSPKQMGHSPNEMGHSPKQMNHAMKMKHSPMPMKGPYTMRPSILNQMSHNK